MDNNENTPQEKVQDFSNVNSSEQKLDSNHDRNFERADSGFERNSGRGFERNSERGFDRNSERGFDRNSERGGERRFERSDRPAVKRPPLRETIMNMDQDILKMLARRSNILDKMKAKQGHLDPKEEKTLRTSWEKNATQMTRDPRVIQQIFALFQEIEFSAKPQFGDEKRVSFNLSPTKEAIDVQMHAPMVSRRSRLYLSLAGASGSALHIRPSLLSDPEVECVKMFNQCATSLAWDEDGSLRAREGGGLSLPDKVIFVGDDILNFYLLLGHYVGSLSRAKFTGDSTLKFLDLSTLRSFLPQLGARLSNAIPGTMGFPLRIECSGILPDAIQIPANIDADAVLGFMLAAPFWEKEVSFDLSKHAQAEQIIEEALSVLVPSCAMVKNDGHIVHISPSKITTPKEPILGMEMSFAAYLLAMPAFTSGKVQLEGLWPKCEIGDSIITTLKSCGVEVAKTEGQIITSSLEVTEKLNQEKLNATCFDERFIPLAIALAIAPALCGRPAYMPDLSDNSLVDDINSFMNNFGFETNHDGQIVRMPHFEESGVAWTASSPYWAMAYSLCAFIKSQMKLTNPGIMTSLYPQFWNLYNALPFPHIKKPTLELVDEKPVRRRIIAADQDGAGSGDNLAG